MRIHAWGFVATAILFLALGAGVIEAGKHPAIVRAQQAVASGKVDPAGDLAPLVQALAAAKTEDDQRDLIAAVSDLGAGSGSSPAAVKKYLLEQGTPALLDLAKRGASVFVKGNAMFALRDMGASRPVLEQAAAIAEADPEDFVRSRGQILRNFIKSMPAESTASTIRPSDPAREQQGLAFLAGRGLGASPDQLRRSAQEGDVEAVQALLDAGVDPNGTGAFAQRPLYAATFSGCGAKSGETDGLVATVDALLAGGADVKGTGDNNTTVLFAAAQMCGPRIVSALVAAGADISARNGAGMSPLAMALIMRKLDAAEVLVAKGAKLSAQEREMLGVSVTDPRGKDLVKKASGR